MLSIIPIRSVMLSLLGQLVSSQLLMNQTNSLLSVINHEATILFFCLLGQIFIYNLPPLIRLLTHRKYKLD